MDQGCHLSLVACNNTLCDEQFIISFQFEARFDMSSTIYA